MIKNSAKNIYISYRVKDSAGETGRLVEALTRHFDKRQIFIDCEFQPGVDFVEAIGERLNVCDVMLVIIGADWLASWDRELPLIHDPNDWIHIEVATALQRGIKVVPVLVDDAELPSMNSLPEDLHALLRRQSYKLTNRRWHEDVERLIQFLIVHVGMISVNAKSEIPDKMGNTQDTDVENGQLVFLSYSRTDSEFAVKLANDLQKAGKNIWIDVQNLKFGKTWDKEIQKALNLAVCVLVVISETSVERDNVLNEVQYALDKGKTIIPICIGSCDLPINLYRRQYIDFSAGYENAFERLVKSLVG